MPQPHGKGKTPDLVADEAAAPTFTPEQLALTREKLRILDEAKCFGSHGNWRVTRVLEATEKDVANLHQFIDPEDLDAVIAEGEAVWVGRKSADRRGRFGPFLAALELSRQMDHQHYGGLHFSFDAKAGWAVAVPQSSRVHGFQLVSHIGKTRVIGEVYATIETEGPLVGTLTRGDNFTEHLVDKLDEFVIDVCEEAEGEDEFAEVAEKVMAAFKRVTQPGPDTVLEVKLPTPALPAPEQAADKAATTAAKAADKREGKAADKAAQPSAATA